MKIAYKLWSTGLINQLLSLEICVGISSIYNTPPLLYNIRKNSIYSPIAYEDNGRNFLVKEPNQQNTPSLTDLVDWDNKDWTLEFEDISEELKDYQKIHIIDYFIDCKGEEDQAKIEGKEFVPQINLNYNFETTILFYSQFFKNRNSKVDLALSKIKWKQEYLNLAKRIANELGEFSGAHLRMTDHRKVVFAISEQGFLEQLDYLQSKELPIIICTDDPKFSWIKYNSKKYSFIDDIIVNNWSDTFRNLPFSDEIAFSLICNLVMGYCKYFVGTPSSTYSAYIQRNINNRINQFEWKFFDGDFGTDFSKYPKDYEPKPRWWREYSNSKLVI